MQLTDVDKQIMESFKQHRTYMGVQRATGIDRRTVERHIMKMRVAGIDLPESLGQGNFASLSKERLKELAILGGKNPKKTKHDPSE